MKHYTSMEQSKILVGAGLDPKSADMSYRWTYCKEQDGHALEDWLLEPYTPCDESPDEQIPCWSIGALIQLMPNDLSDYELMINSCSVRYYDCEEWHSLIWFDTSDGDLTTCCVKTILWLLEKGHIKKGGEK